MSTATGAAAPVLLVVAKAPVPGTAKTRLQAWMSAEEAAQVAAACLLDTLDVVAAAPASARVVAMTGDLDRAARHDELEASLCRFTVVAQRGSTFAERLAAAHHDALASAAGIVPAPAVIQIGMDTPQVAVADLVAAAEVLDAYDAVLGPADDGGWWLLGLRATGVETGGAALVDVPMSRPDTRDRTRDALERAGLRVGATRELRDVDEPGDLASVAAAGTLGGRFVRVLAGVGDATTMHGSADRYTRTGMGR